MPNGIPYPNKLDDSISILRVIDCYCVCVFIYFFIDILIEYFVCKQWKPRRRVWFVSGLANVPQKVR